MSRTVVLAGRSGLRCPMGALRLGNSKAGEALLRAPVTHADEALDDLEVVLIDIKSSPRGFDARNLQLPPAA